MQFMANSVQYVGVTVKMFMFAKLESYSNIRTFQPFIFDTLTDASKTNVLSGMDFYVL